MIVTISGLAGAGTSTTAERLSDELGVDALSAGQVFRQEAREHDMTLEEFGEYAYENPEIDRRIDERQAEIAASSDALVVEGRLAGWMVDADLSVWLKAPLGVRARRVADREHEDLDEVRRKVEDREECEARRYREFYDIDIADLSTYDVVLDTSRWSPGGIVSILRTAIGHLK